MFIFPAFAFLGSFFQKKFWGKPGVMSCLTLTALLSILYQLVIFLIRIFSFSQEGGVFNLILENFNDAFVNTIKATASNSLILSPLFYLLLSRLNELFDYWEQRKRL